VASPQAVPRASAPLDPVPLTPGGSARLWTHFYHELDTSLPKALIIEYNNNDETNDNDVVITRFQSED
jgi:hypothetical protein